MAEILDILEETRDWLSRLTAGQRTGQKVKAVEIASLIRELTQLESLLIKEENNE